MHLDSFRSQKPLSFDILPRLLDGNFSSKPELFRGRRELPGTSYLLRSEKMPQFPNAQHLFDEP